ncbi:MAG: redoxin domain-containing protein [Dehalococcoidia bacterium]|nr:redoxin domain-containing protein [Dehalococcoidia bacterium]
MGQAVAHDDATACWYFGAPLRDTQTRMLTLAAPDFELPDLQGRTHRLSDHRGKKVFLLSWASW